MVAEGNRLRHLQMGEAGHDGVGVAIGLLDQGTLQFLQTLLQPVERVAHPQPEIGRHLVIARPRRVQPAAGRADQVGEPRLDVEMDVFELGRETELAALDLGTNLRQSRLDGAAVGGRQDLARHQHVGVRQRARDILGVEPLVEADGGVDLLHDGIGTTGKAAAPHLVAHSRP